ncbi:unnamed protein product [Orchesella dallaii]
MDVAIDAIVSEYVLPWYTKISDDSSFLDNCKIIIHDIFVQLGEKLRNVDRNDFAKEAIQIIHVHWKEYTDAVNKNQQFNSDELLKTFKFVHPFLQDSKEVSKRYQNLVGKVMEELSIPDLQSSVLCQFLAGIIVKNFFLFYVEMLCSPSWINGSLMSLLSAGHMSVDITGNSSQNSSSPASPIPDPSPKGINLFGDDALELASIGPSSTTESTPTKKSCSSSVRSTSGSQEEYSAKSEQSDTKKLLESLSSIEDGSSSEPKTESSESAGASPIDKHFILQPASNSGATPSFFPDPIVLSKRPKDLAPFKPSGSMRTLSTAFGSVLQATALPLLPSECYSEENTLVLPKYCQPKLATVDQPPILEDVIDSKNAVNNAEDNVTIKTDTDSESTQPSSDTDKILATYEQKDSPSGNGNKNMTSSHYYSFDEASKPKAAPASFFEASTLSLDGAIDSRRQLGKDQLQLCSHAYRSEIGTGKPNRSPVYEEPEDFAASIAKLRSLLEQKERKSSTPPLHIGEEEDVFENLFPVLDKSVSEPTTAVPQISETYASDSNTTPSSASSSMEHSSKASSFSFNEPILSSETNSTIIDPIERSNYEPVPEIKCCFQNVIIPKVENSTDVGGQYIFYCIQYEGVYFDDKEEGQPQKIVYRTTTIKRKFKEFLTLQAHLEENSACKPHLKGIKTPTRWLNVSLTKSDATVAHQRRAMLEKYLQQLCYHPVIGFCQELMIFMAYGEDGFCSFEVGDPKDLLTHRLDKLAKKFTGVFNSLKDALPSFELDLSPAPNTPKSEGITPCDFKSESSFPSFPFQEKYSSLPHDKALDLEVTWVGKFPSTWASDNPDSTKQTEGKNDDELSTDPTAFPEPGIDVEEGNKIFSTYPLAAAVTQLLCDVLWLPQYRPHPASVATFMSISGKSLENYVVESMDIFLSEEAILGYLEWLTISINSGQSDTDSRCDGNNEFYSEQDLKNIVKRRIPAWVRWMWGRNRLELTIDRITGLFQNPLVNHDLILSLCELLFSKMVTVDENIME